MKSCLAWLQLIVLLTGISLIGGTNSIEASESFAPSTQSQSPRKGSVTVKLLDSVGIPLANAIVKYNQTTHDFLFGVGMTTPRAKIPTPIFVGLRAIGVNYAQPFTTWQLTEPIEGLYNWRNIDNLYQPAEMKQLGYTLKGHATIQFHDQPYSLPAYVRAKNFEQLKQAIPKHVSALVEHYKGIITLWEISEPTFVSDFFQLSKTQWVEIAHVAAQTVHQTDPQAQVVVNLVPADMPRIGYSPHGILDDFVSQGVEFDVIGVELYSRPEFKYVPDANGYPSVEWASAMLDSYARFGKTVHLSEIGVVAKPSPEAQAIWLRAFYAMAFEKPYVSSITWYFVEDDASNFLPGAGLFPTLESPPRPIYQALADVIQERTTQGSARADSQGVIRIEGYAGDYKIEVDDGIHNATFTIHITEQKDSSVTLSLQPATITPAQQDSAWVGISLIAAGGVILFFISRKRMTKRTNEKAK